MESESEWWEVIWNAGFRRMVTQLDPLAQEQFKQDRLREVATLSTKDGIWLDIGTWYTIGRK